MTSNEFGQGEGTLTTAAGMVTDARGDFDRIAGKLTEQIAAVQGQWGGAGAQAFFALNAAWTEKQQTIVSALDEFATSLGVTEKDNVSTDETQGGNYARLTSRMS